MNKPLDGALILVADDQIDVAKTHCRPLHQAGARLRYVADGRTALTEVATRPVDLLLVDMKMPPEDWGGLWLLQELRSGGWGVPALVLSGEGRAQQLKQAIRLGANDWMDKDSADEELLDRCVAALNNHRATALDDAAVRMPTPLAHRFDRYTRTTDPDKRLSEGLHTLEAVLRFAAALGFSSTPPTPLRGISPTQIATPSMGTWLSLCIALADAPSAGEAFTRLLSYLIPDRSDRQTVQNFVSVRNALSHGGAKPDGEQGRQLDALLSRFARRMLSAWRCDLALSKSMTYDGSEYCVEVLKLRGVARPVPDRIRTNGPLVTEALVLLSPGQEPLSLAPWLLACAADGSDMIRCMQFDGVEHSRSGLTPQTPLRYKRLDDGDHVMPQVGEGAGTWQSLVPWIGERP